MIRKWENTIYEYVVEGNFATQVLSSYSLGVQRRT